MSEDIHSDGTVETITRWRPGGAQGAEPEFQDGDEIVIAVRTVEDSWLYSSTSIEAQAHTIWLDADWLWSEVEWWCPAAEIDLPFIREPQS